jgi:16S rRNA (cytidine1402-2'-O)-methyltransferase
MKKGKLYLIPAVISEDTQADVIPSSVLQILPELKFFLVENVRTARRFLSSLKIYESIEPLHFEVLDKNTGTEMLEELFKPVREGHSLGIISESGCPAVADPGAIAVDYAHKNNITVVPLVGPSSILLALMASGLNGQRFAFHGYLPIESKELVTAVQEFERESKKKRQTQIFIETPYRNNAVMAAMLRTLSDNTLLTAAIDLTGKGESIKTFEVRKWKTLKPDFPKAPAVFLFLAS